MPYEVQSKLSLMYQPSAPEDAVNVQYVEGYFDGAIDGIGAVAKKYSETITGDGSAVDFVVEHNLGTPDVSATIKNVGTKALALADVTEVDDNNVKISFAAAPTVEQSYRITVIG